MLSNEPPAQPSNNDHQNYKRLFKEILQSSIKTNCLCYYLNSKKNTDPRNDSRNKNLQTICLFDNYGAYLEDDDVVFTQPKPVEFTKCSKFDCKLTVECCSFYTLLFFFF